MKKIIENFKVLWMDERGRALIKLSAYLLFMVFVIMYARSIVHNPNNNEKTVKSSYEKFISQINYVADIKVDEEQISLTGGDITSFTYNEENYIVIDSKVTKNQIEAEDDFDIYFWKVTPKFIGEILTNREPEYTSNYKDGLVKKGYKISLYDFLEKHNISNVNVDDIETIPDEYIEVVIEDAGNKIELVTLNLDSYYRFVTGENKSFSIEIKY